MNYRIGNQGKNIKIELLENRKQIAKATCYFKDTPKIDNKEIGCIGEFEANAEDVGIQIIEKCEVLLKEQGVDLIVAPMDGNTWKKYRTLKTTNGESEFLLENVNPIEHNEIFKKAGYKELYTYTSNKGLIENAYNSEIIDIAEEKSINIILKNTICNATKQRQEETTEISKTVDMMIIIGGKHSSNTLKLFEISKDNCKNAILIETYEELNKELFNGINKVGIMAGASTPKESIDNVVEFLSNL